MTKSSWSIDWQHLYYIRYICSGHWLPRDKEGIKTIEDNTSEYKLSLIDPFKNNYFLYSITNITSVVYSYICMLKYLVFIVQYLHSAMQRSF